MYFVDREKIERTLAYMETISESYVPPMMPQNELERLALERVASVLIEAIIDVGNSMIDGFIMRDPGGYTDIIDILEDEKVIGAEQAASLKELIQLRKQLVQEYVSVNIAEVIEVMTKSQAALRDFPKDVRRYLIEELGPVSAFLPDKQTES
ncbi:DUF86 domain-containing protein [Alkalihalobacillus oceani]|uniref:DUF86 domain-containing protein n=1 Tax=Halalkalibacter oceani TaxID=1653776 RepID=UPI00203BFD76|nr:DUF86 domain-containing protein [Halalkalibacter oceani]